MRRDSQPASADAEVVSARKEMFIDFCALLEEQGIPYAILAGYEQYPAHIGSDVDFMVSEPDFHRLPTLFGRADCIPGAKLIQVLQHQPTSRYFVLARQVGSRLAFLHPDSACDYRLNARLWLRSDTVLASRRKSPLGFWIPAASVEFEYYLIKRIVDKALCEEAHLARLHRAWAEDIAGCRTVLERMLPAAMAEAAAAAIVGGDVIWFAREMSALRACVAATPALEPTLRRFASFVAEVRRWALRAAQPTGLVLAVLGPDGSGKTTVLSHLEREFAPAFRRVRRFHLRPHFGHTRAGGVVTDPHAQAPRGWFTSALKVGLFLTDYIWCWVRVIWSGSVRSTLFLFDRYFHDMLADPTRYRLPKRFMFARWAARLIPKPDVWLVLTAPAELLLARKDELPLEAARELAKRYEELVALLPGAHLIRTAQPLDQVLSQTVAAVRCVLEERVARRFSVPR